MSMRSGWSSCELEAQILLMRLHGHIRARAIRGQAGVDTAGNARCRRSFCGWMHRPLRDCLQGWKRW